MTTDNARNDDTSLEGNNKEGEHGPDYEALAREMGWRPKDEFKGDAALFVDAKTYYERGQTVLPIVQAEARALRQELERTRADAHKALEIANRANEREVADLQAQVEAAKLTRKEAIKEADGDTFESADERVKALEAEIAKLKQASKDTSTSTQLDPGYVAWLNRPEQSWFNSDEEAQAMAEGLVRLPKYKHLIGQREKLWDAVVGDLKKMKDAQRAGNRADLERPGPEGAGRGNGEVRARAGERSFVNLTSDMQKTCDRQYKDFGITIPKEKWRERYVNGCADDAFRK